VTANNVKATIVKDGFWKTADLCAGAFASACRSYGIQ